MSSISRPATERRESGTGRIRSDGLSSSPKLLRLLHDAAIASNESDSVSQAMRFTLKRICDEQMWPVGRFSFFREGVEAAGVSEIWHWGRPPRPRDYRSSLRRAFPADGGVVREVARSGKSRWVEDVRPGADAHATQTPVRALFGFPISMDGEIVGVGQLFGDRPVRKNTAFEKVMVAIGIQLGHAVERWVLQHQAATAAVREQQRFGRELHDSVSQQLTGIAMMAEMLSEELSGAGFRQASKLEDLVTYVRQAQAEVHALARGLMPVVDVDEEGFRHALEQLAESTSTMHDIRCRFSCDGTATVENSQVATHLYRIAQEAVQNAVKHGEAKNITIGLASRGGRLILSVSDDGRGFKRRKGKKVSSGVGLRLMRHRAGVISGKLTVRSSEGQGTVICCSRPSPLSAE